MVLAGLTTEEAQKRLEKFGPNVLPEKPPPSSFNLCSFGGRGFSLRFPRLVRFCEDLVK